MDRQGRDRVRPRARFLANAGVVKARLHNNPQKAKPKKKAQERAAAAAKAAEAANAGRRYQAARPAPWSRATFFSPPSSARRA